MDLPFPGWTNPHDRFDLRRKLAACDRLASIARSLSDRKLSVGSDPVHQPTNGTTSMPLCVFEEFGRAVKTFNACLQLASTGYGQPAVAIAAIVVQSSLIVLWADQKGKVVDRMADLHARYGLQRDLDERRRLGLWKGLPENDYLSATDRAEAEKLFNSNPQSLWTGHGTLTDLIRDMAAEEQDEFTSRQLLSFDVMAARASAMAAGTGIAHQSFRVVQNLPEGGAVMAVKLGQGPEAISEALHTASAAFLPAIDTVVSRYAPELKDDVRRAHALLWRAWKETDELVGLADDDDCPCDRPGTKWGQCHKWTEELGTVQYVPFTDADLVHFTPYDPKLAKSASIKARGGFDCPQGPLILTFTFKLPFMLGLLDGGAYQMVLHDTWAEQDDIAHFGRLPTVRIRLHNEPTDGLDLWPKRAGNALRSFFGNLEDRSDLTDWPAIPGIYEQWVTLETPSGRLKMENSEDAAYAFHRAFHVLNAFLMTLDLAMSDPSIRAVTTQEIGPIVFRGAWTRDGKWQRLADVLMHPDSFQAPLNPQSLNAMQTQLDASWHDLQGGRLFVMASLWHSRALRAFRLRGDLADCVVSLQTAAESMMYDLLRGLMVDTGRTASEIKAAVNAELRYKSLLNSEFAKWLGGCWDLSSAGPVGRYWKEVYLLRNRIVHGGYTPDVRETDDAMEAFVRVREYVSELLWKKYPKYPRTLVAKVGVNGLERRGWLTKRVRGHCQQFGDEGSPFYWPRDVAGRP